MKRSRKSIVKWILYSALLLVLFVMQTTPGLFEIKGIKPVYIVPLAVFIAVFESELGGLIFAVITGLLWDSAADKLLGFSSILLGAACVAVALITIFYIRATLLNCCVLSAAIMILYVVFDYIFIYAVWGYGNTLFILFRNLLPMALYTIVISPLIFLAVKAVASKYNDIIRV